MKLPKMSQAEREAFLAAPHIGVLAVAEPGRGPCAVPVWYRYQPGGLVRITAGRRSRKVALARSAGRASLCAQREAPPSQYVSIEGPLEVIETDVSDLQREIAVHYLGERRASAYLESFSPGLQDEVMLVLHPERWWTVDFSKPLGEPG